MRMELKKNCEDLGWDRVDFFGEKFKLHNYTLSNFVFLHNNLVLKTSSFLSFFFFFCFTHQIIMSTGNFKWSNKRLDIFYMNIWAGPLSTFLKSLFFLLMDFYD